MDDLVEELEFGERRRDPAVQQIMRKVEHDEVRQLAGEVVGEAVYEVVVGKCWELDLAAQGRERAAEDAGVGDGEVDQLGELN